MLCWLYPGSSEAEQSSYCPNIDTWLWHGEREKLESKKMPD